MDLKAISEKFKKLPTDVTGLDIGTTNIKAVRMKKAKDGTTTLVAADILPPLENTESGAHPAPYQLPPKLRGKYVSFAVSAERSIIKLLPFPGAFDSAAEAKLAGNLGVEDPSGYRISYKVITQGHGRVESRVLAVALQADAAAAVTALFPTGIPAPFSMEISGLATMTAFLNGPGAAHKENTIGAIDFGANVSTFAIFNKGQLGMIRRFDAGTNLLLERVQNSLGVDRETAQGIVSDGAFDISQATNEVLEPLVKQMMVSRDFIERKENCHMQVVYISGALALSRDSFDVIHSAMGVEVNRWNVLDGLNVDANAIPSSIAGQEWRLSAAIGACQATFEVE